MPAESAISPDIHGFLRTRGGDAALAELAERQHGVVARWQLIALGFRKGAIEHRLSVGRLHRVHAGVYAVGHRVLSREGRWMAAVLASGPEAVLSHRSAAALWGIRRTAPEVIDVTVPRRSRSSPRIRRHVGVLPEDERAEHLGVPVTTAARTVWNLAATSPRHQVEADLRQLEFLRLYDGIALPHLLDRYPGARGCRRVRAALEQLREAPEGRTRSALEERFLAFLDRYGLPRPQLNAWLELPGGGVEVDCLWPGTGTVVELDGWQAHGTRSAFVGDRTRDRRLRAAGYHVTRIAWSQLDAEPEAIAADLRSFLRPPTSAPRRNLT